MRIEPLYVIRGQEDPVHPVSRTLEEDLLETIGRWAGEEYQQLAQQEIDPLICPVHQQHAVITISVSTYVESDETFEGGYQLTTCCQEFRDSVTEYLHLQ